MTVSLSARDFRWLQHVIVGGSDWAARDVAVEVGQARALQRVEDATVPTVLAPGDAIFVVDFEVVDAVWPQPPVWLHSWPVRCAAVEVDDPLTARLVDGRHVTVRWADVFVTVEDAVVEIEKRRLLVAAVRARMVTAGMSARVAAAMLARFKARGVALPAALESALKDTAAAG